MKRFNKLALVLILLACPASASAQQENLEQPFTYDMRFLDRDSHKPSNPFTVSGNDFHKHSYRRMLLNSPFGASSVGLGANSMKQIYNKDAYDYMNPNSNKINQPTVRPELDSYIDNAYGPKVGKHYSNAYETNNDYDQPNPYLQLGAQPQQQNNSANENRFNAAPSPFDNYSQSRNQLQQLQNSASSLDQRLTPQPGGAGGEDGTTSTPNRIPSFLSSPSSSPQFGSQ